MRINELFTSIQGEGIHAGIPMAFIRTQTCPYKCAWCDTERTWDKNGGFDMSVRAILDWLSDHPDVEWVCFTGGEPMLQKDAAELLIAINRHSNKKTVVETSGLLDITDYFTGTHMAKNIVNSWVVDVKCPSSGESEKNKFANLHFLDDRDQVKFVVGTWEDLDYTGDIYEKHILPSSRPPHILISPVFALGDYTPDLTPQQIASHVLVNMPFARVSLQIHKYLEVP